MNDAPYQDSALLDGRAPVPADATRAGVHGTLCAAPRTQRPARLARVYDRAQVRFQRRLLTRAALTDEAWRLCARLIRATEQDAGLARPER